MIETIDSVEVVENAVKIETSNMSLESSNKFPWQKKGDVFEWRAHPYQHNAAIPQDTSFAITANVIGMLENDKMILSHGGFPITLPRLPDIAPNTTITLYFKSADGSKTKKRRRV